MSGVPARPEVLLRASDADRWTDAALQQEVRGHQREFLSHDEMNDLARFLCDLGFDVALDREAEDALQHSGVIHDMLTYVPPMVDVLKIVGAAAGGAAAKHALPLMVEAWKARTLGRSQTPATTRATAIGIARMRLALEFDVQMHGVPLVEERQEPDGAWTIAFHLDGYELIATVPADVRDLTQR